MGGDAQVWFGMVLEVCTFSPNVHCLIGTLGTLGAFCGLYRARGSSEIQGWGALS